MLSVVFLTETCLLFFLLVFGLLLICGFPVQLIETGEKERLMELLRERLVECGWKDDMKALCRYFVDLTD